jgi:hypothetical protein
MIRKLVGVAFRAWGVVTEEWEKLSDEENTRRIALVPQSELETQALQQALSDRRAAVSILKERKRQEQQRNGRFGAPVENGEAE